MAEQKPRRTGRHSGSIPAVEWVAAAAGMMLVALVLGVTAYQAIWGDHSPPDIVVRITSVSPRDGGFHVGFAAANRGGSPAEGVVIEASSGDVPIGQTTIDYLPAHSTREGGLFVSVDPARPGFRVRALGYEKP